MDDTKTYYIVFDVAAYDEYTYPMSALDLKGLKKWEPYTILPKLFRLMLDFISFYG